MTTNIRKFQFAAALTHFFVFLLCTWNALHAPSDALWQAVWFPLFWPDLPASIILVLSWILAPKDIADTIESIFHGIFSTYPYYSFWNFWYLIFLYGVIGTIWWFYLPNLIMRILKRFNILREKEA